jgi:hypothetical protein
MHEAGDDQEGHRRQHGRAEQAQVVAGRHESPGRALDPEQQFDDQGAQAVIGRLQQGVGREGHVDDEVAPYQQGQGGQQHVGRDLAGMPHETNLFGLEGRVAPGELVRA